MKETTVTMTAVEVTKIEIMVTIATVIMITKIEEIIVIMMIFDKIQNWNQISMLS